MLVYIPSGFLLFRSIELIIECMIFDHFSVHTQSIIRNFNSIFVPLRYCDVIHSIDLDNDAANDALSPYHSMNLLHNLDVGCAFMT